MLFPADKMNLQQMDVKGKVVAVDAAATSGSGGVAATEFPCYPSIARKLISARSFWLTFADMNEATRSLFPPWSTSTIPTMSERPIEKQGIFIILANYFSFWLIIAILGLISLHKWLI